MCNSYINIKMCILWLLLICIELGSRILVQATARKLVEEKSVSNSSSEEYSFQYTWEVKYFKTF